MENNKKDMSTSLLGKIMSFDFLVVLVVMGISWGTLTQRVSGLDARVENNREEVIEQVDELRAESSKVNYEVFQINRKLDVMGNNQEHFKEQLTGLDGRSKEILTLLQKSSTSR